MNFCASDSSDGGLGGVPQPKGGDGGRRTVSKDVYAGAELDNVFGGVVVVEPVELQVVSVVGVQVKAMKHGLDVGDIANLALPKAE